ncbi:MAG: hypothetical protein J6Z23_06620, partial [Lachnospiraceae bacterium]|nr:hypothetical protein [Lachnospiraceae bacterium]
VADSTEVKVRATNPSCLPKEASYTLTVTPAPVTVKAGDLSKVYGTEDPALTASVVLPEDWDEEIPAPVLAYEAARAEGETVGTYAVTVTGEALQQDFEVTFEGGTLTVEVSDALAVTGTDYEGVYDGQAHGTEAAVNVDETVQLLYSTDGGETWLEAFPTVTHVADSTTVLVKASNPNYTDAEATYTLTVKPAPVTVKADDFTKAAGDEDPEWTATVTPGRAGEGEEPAEGEETAEEDLAALIEYTISREEGETPGEYAIIPAGEELQGDYTVTYENGTLTIEVADKLELTVEDYEGVYDGKSHGGTVSVNIEEDTLLEYSTDGGETWSETAPEVKDAEDSTEVKVRATNPSYETKEAAYKLTVKPIAVIVRADDLVKAFGEKDPKLTATIRMDYGDEEPEEEPEDPFFEDVKELLTFELTREEGEAVGTYAITPEGEASQGNYSVTYEPGTLTIETSDELKVTAADYEGVYDGEAHGKAAVVNIDDEDLVIEYSTDDGETWTKEVPEVREVADSVTVRVRASGENYETAEATYTLTVKPAEVTVTAQNRAKSYGAEDPALTVLVTGLKGTDTSDILKYEVTREEGENAGTYMITPEGEEEQGNYIVKYVSAALTITKAAGLTFIGSSVKVPYDGTAHTLDITPAVTEGTQMQFSTDGGISWRIEAPSATYPEESVRVIVRATNPNYADAVSEYSLTIDKAEIRVTTADYEKDYDGKEITDTVLAGTVNVTGVARNEAVEIQYLASGKKDAGEYANGVVIVFGDGTGVKIDAGGTISYVKTTYNGASQKTPASVDNYTVVVSKIGKVVIRETVPESSKAPETDRPTDRPTVPPTDEPGETEPDNTPLWIGLGAGALATAGLGIGLLATRRKKKKQR